ncbi:MAG: host factor-I protein [Halanaerobiales bacterium]|nr:host factor-I protein [Halanaerobiales bacterium]
MKHQLNLQDNVLNQVRKQKTPVTIYLVNGFQLNGIVTGFDNFTIIVRDNGKDLMVYKHAISTIIPQEGIEGLLNPKRSE